MLDREQTGDDELRQPWIGSGGDHVKRMTADRQFFASSQPQVSECRQQDARDWRRGDPLLSARKPHYCRLNREQKCAERNTDAKPDAAAPKYLGAELGDFARSHGRKE